MSHFNFFQIWWSMSKEFLSGSKGINMMDNLNENAICEKGHKQCDESYVKMEDSFEEKNVITHKFIISICIHWFWTNILMISLHNSQFHFVLQTYTPDINQRHMISTCIETETFYTFQFNRKRSHKRTPFIHVYKLIRIYLNFMHLDFGRGHV